MAVRTIAAGGGNWNATTTWIEGIVPIAGDTVFAAGTSGQLTVNVASACTSINFTNYTNTLTMNATLSVGGNVTLVATMTIAGAGTLSLTAAATITSNGKTWSGAMGSTGAFAITLNDSWTIVGTLTLTSAGSGAVYNGYSLTIGGGITVYGNGNRTVSGTTTFILNGTGTWSGGTSSFITNNLTINTAGTITISGGVNYAGGTLTYTAGTMIVTGSTLNIFNQASTVDTSGMTWNNVAFQTSVVYTLISDLNLSGLLTLGGSTNTTTINGSTINVSGGITMRGTTAVVTGTTNIKITGGTISPTSTVQLRLNLEIAGDITIGTTGTFYFNSKTLTYTSGVVTTTGSVLRVTATTTLNTNGIIWNNVRLEGISIVITLTSDLNTNILTLGTSTNQTTINGSTINVSGGITMAGVSGGFTAGTTNIKITGGTITSSGMTLRSPLEIAGDVTIVSGTTITYNTGTITYTSGKVTTIGSTLALTGSATLINMDKIAWNIVTVTVGTTLTMNKFFSGSPKQKTTIQSSTSGTAITITFQDIFEKTAKFVKVSDCSLTRKGQLLVLTPNSDKGGNSGIRYINQSPNGIAKNSPTVAGPIAYPAAGLVTDPCFISL